MLTDVPLLLNVNLLCSFVLSTQCCQYNEIVYVTVIIERVLLKFWNAPSVSVAGIQLRQPPYPDIE